MVLRILGDRIKRNVRGSFEPRTRVYLDASASMYIPCGQCSQHSITEWDNSMWSEWRAQASSRQSLCWVQVGRRIFGEALPWLNERDVEIAIFGDGPAVRFRYREGEMGNGEEVIKTWNSSCMGGTLIWQRIAEDLQVNPVSKSSQAEVKLLIITDGHDTDSRGEYHGIFGCRKLAADIAELGIDAEIHIVSLGVTDVVVLSEYEDLTSWSGGEVFYA